MITGKKINETLKLGAKHSLYSKDSKWYHHLKSFPGILFDLNGYVKFENEKDYLNNPHLQHGHDLHVINGINNIPGYTPFSVKEIAKIKSL